MVAGAAAITEGGSGAGLGIAACATGAGCVVGGVAVVAGGGLVLMGAGTGLRGAEGAATTLAQFASRNSNGSSMTESQIMKAMRSLQDRMAEHEAKPQAYIDDPDAYDNKGLLGRVSEQIREQIIQARIRHLQNEINNYRNQIERLDGLLEQRKWK